MRITGQRYDRVEFDCPMSKRHRSTTNLLKLATVCDQTRVDWRIAYEVDSISPEKFKRLALKSVHCSNEQFICAHLVH